MWFPLTLVITTYTLKKRNKFYLGEKGLSNSSETTWWFSSWAFYHFSSYIQEMSIWGHLWLPQQNPPVKQTQKHLLPDGCEWSRAWWVRFPSSVFQPGLVNSNKFRGGDFRWCRQAGSYSPAAYCTLPWGSAPWYIHHPERSWSQILTARLSIFWWAGSCVNEN